MLKSETLEDFYKRYPGTYPVQPTIPRQALGNFNINLRESCAKYAPYNRRDYYKISLIIGRGNLYYADKTIEINKNALVFFNPQVPYAWEATSDDQSGYFYSCTR
jgi:hypothetical protein